MNESDKTLGEIMSAAGRHPRSDVSHLIRLVEAERSQRNIMLLLVKLAEHAEYSVDFSISLRYYLDLFDRLGIGKEIELKEAGILLLSSSKVYSRRVDYVHELVQQQILSLTELEKANANANKRGGKEPTTAKQPNRGRKRLVATCIDPMECTFEPKKFRLLTIARRFGKPPAAVAAAKRNPLPNTYKTEQFIHPALYRRSIIVDLESEDIDSKRNYCLFSHHVEHRYNTLISDLDFSMHFMVKDYIEKENERIQDDPRIKDHVWPPLSEEYMKKYVGLENQVLEAELERLRNRFRSVTHAPLEETAVKDTTANSLMTDQNVICTKRKERNDPNNLQNATEQVRNTSAAKASAPNDSGMGDSFMDDSGRSVEEGTHGNGTLPTSRNDSALGANIGELKDTQIESHKNAENAATASSPLADDIKIDVDVAESLQDEGVIDLSEIRFHLPDIIDGQEIRFSELNAPSCVATDVLRGEAVEAMNGPTNLFTFRQPLALVPPLPALQLPKAKNLKRTRPKVVRERRGIKKLNLPSQSAKVAVIEEERPNFEPPQWSFVTARRDRMLSVDSKLEFSGFVHSNCSSDNGEFSGFRESLTTAVLKTAPPVTDIESNGLATSLEAIKATMPTYMAMESIVIDSEDATEEYSAVVGAKVIPENEDYAFAANPVSGMAKRVREWHDRMQPILAKSRQRQHFDVFEIGTEIIDELQTHRQITQDSDDGAPGPSAAGDIVFADIMRNKEKSNVSRYFLSTLLLANEGNIEINVRNQNCEAPSAWSDIELKLLSTERSQLKINLG